MDAGIQSTNPGATTGSVARTGLKVKARKESVSYLPCVFVLCLLVPNFFHLGSLRLAPFLVFLLILFVPLFFKWIRGKAGPIQKADWFILLSCFWGGTALALAHGISQAIEPFGILVVQTFGAYLVGRCLVRNKETFLTVFKLYLLILVFLLPFALLETTSARPVYLNLFSQLGPVHANVWMEPRMGLDRVQAAFEHPILFGVFVASGFSVLFVTSKMFKRLLIVPLTFAVTIFSVSTGAILCLVTQCAILTWGALFRSSEHRWRNLILLVLVCYIIVDLGSNRTPFNVFVDYLTFNSGSSYNRILIWKYGTAEVWRHPFFGIGLNEWERPSFMSSSMDNFWLLIAVRYGLPALILLALGYFSILLGVGRRKNYPEDLVPLRLGVLVSIVGVMVAICSVHLWNSTFTWFMFLMGSTVWLSEHGDSPKKKEKRSVLLNSDTV